MVAAMEEPASYCDCDQTDDDNDQHDNPSPMVLKPEIVSNRGMSLEKWWQRVGAMLTKSHYHPNLGHLVDLHLSHLRLVYSLDLWWKCSTWPK